MYLRIDGEDFGFVEEGIHEIMPTDIEITDAEHECFLESQSAGKNYRVKQAIDPDQGLTGCIEEFTPGPIVLPKTEVDLLSEELINAKLAIAELTEMIMGGGEIE